MGNLMKATSEKILLELTVRLTLSLSVWEQAMVIANDYLKVECEYCLELLNCCYNFCNALSTKYIQTCLERTCCEWRSGEVMALGTWLLVPKIAYAANHSYSLISNHLWSTRIYLRQVTKLTQNKVKICLDKELVDMTPMIIGV